MGERNQVNNAPDPIFSVSSIRLVEKFGVSGIGLFIVSVTVLTIITVKPPAHHSDLMNGKW